ncbi:MAG: hypothetical protein WA183_12750 [Chthoniobacterales bacterium]
MKETLKVSEGDCSVLAAITFKHNGKPLNPGSLARLMSKIEERIKKVIPYEDFDKKGDVLRNERDEWRSE